MKYHVKSFNFTSNAIYTVNGVQLGYIIYLVAVNSIIFTITSTAFSIDWTGTNS